MLHQCRFVDILRYPTSSTFALGGIRNVSCSVNTADKHNKTLSLTKVLEVHVTWSRSYISKFYH